MSLFGPSRSTSPSCRSWSGERTRVAPAAPTRGGRKMFGAFVWLKAIVIAIAAIAAGVNELPP